MKTLKKWIFFPRVDYQIYAGKDLWLLNVNGPVRIGLANSNLTQVKWEQISGNPISIQDAHTPNPLITIPEGYYSEDPLILRMFVTTNRSIYQDIEVGVRMKAVATMPSIAQRHQSVNFQESLRSAWTRRAIPSPNSEASVGQPIGARSTYGFSLYSMASNQFSGPITQYEVQRNTAGTYQTVSVFNSVDEVSVPANLGDHFRVVFHSDTWGDRQEVSQSFVIDQSFDLGLGLIGDEVMSGPSLVPQLTRSTSTSLILSIGKVTRSLEDSRIVSDSIQARTTTTNSTSLTWFVNYQTNNGADSLPLSPALVSREPSVSKQTLTWNVNGAIL